MLSASTTEMYEVIKSRMGFNPAAQRLSDDIVSHVVLWLIVGWWLTALECLSEFTFVGRGRFYIRFDAAMFDFPFSISLILATALASACILGATRAVSRSHPISTLLKVLGAFSGFFVVRAVLESSQLLILDPRLSVYLPDTQVGGWCSLASCGLLFLATLLRTRSDSVSVVWSWRVLFHMTFTLTLAWALTALTATQTADLNIICGGCLIGCVLRRDQLTELLSLAVGEQSSKSRHPALAMVTIAGISLIHGCGGFFNNLPAWKMFHSIDRWEYALTDVKGASVDIRDYVPERSYVVSSHRSVFIVAQWIAKKFPEKTPLSLSLRRAVWKGNTTSWAEEEYKITVSGAADSDALVQLISREQVDP